MTHSITKISLAIAFCLISLVSFSQQTKYSPTVEKIIQSGKSSESHSVWIYFSDKGINLDSKMAAIKASLPAHSLQRRAKTFKDKKSPVTYYDIPLEETYITQISPYINKIRTESRWLNAVSAEITTENIEKIAALSFVKKIDIVRKGKSRRMFSDEKNPENPFSSKYLIDYGSSLTQLEQINVPAVHDMGFHGENVVICIMDAGFNTLEHEVFSTMSILGQYDFVNNDANVDDGTDMGTGDHGTMTLSTIGGYKSGNLIGPAYGANYVLAKTENTDSETSLEEDNWVAAAEWAESNFGPDVTSTSLGYITFDNGTGYSASELDGNTSVITIGADIAASLGILVVNSAGNEGSGVTTIGAPADGDSVLAVGAVDATGTRTSFSSVGPTGDGRIKPEIMAMGSSVYVASPGSTNSYTTADGTSFSCPLTAGGAALLIQMVPNASNMDIINAIKMSGSNASAPNNQYGWGILNVLEAYYYLAPKITHAPLSDSENLNGPFIVIFSVISQYGMVPESPKVQYRIAGGEWIQITPNEITPDNWTAEIPGSGSETNYDYYITAENSMAAVTSPSNAPTSFYSFATGADNTAPTVVHAAISEFYINLWNQAFVEAELSDNIGIDLVNSYVEWSVNSTPQTPSTFQQSEGNVYRAAFPQTTLQSGDIISYRIICKDLSANGNITNFPVSGTVSFNITDRISFEHNDFGPYWNFSGNDAWATSNVQHQDGSYSMVSGDIDDSQNSSASFSFTAAQSGNLTFYRKVSCEDDTYSDNYDYLKFSIDGTEKGRWDGETAWSQITYAVTAGTHTVKWEYMKDGSLSSGSDCAWVDNITLPAGQLVAIEKIPTLFFSIYPNPASKTIFVSTNVTGGIINIYTITGQKVKSIAISDSNMSIDISDLHEGIYLVRQISGNESNTQKITIVK